MKVHSLPLPKSGFIRKICHISDIHIRPGTESKNCKYSRFDEYISVFQRICHFLENNLCKTDDMVICITGDIVHDNKKAGAPCIEIFYEIMLKLSDIAPIYIIRGNHDYNQASIETQDMITSLMYGLHFKSNIAYLSETGYYIANDVCFGVVGIQDALYAGNTHGRVNDLPLFPTVQYIKNMNPSIKYTIGLFHGDVPHTYPLEWFDNNNYDYLFLGDLHGQQIENTHIIDEQISEIGENILHLSTHSTKTNIGPTWAYAGSTIQQNFGESILGHGFIMWDLFDKIAKLYHVKNDYGYVTVCIKRDHENKDIMLNMSAPLKQNMHHEWINIKNIQDIKWFPRIWRLRIKKDKKYQILDTQMILDTLTHMGFNIELSQETLSFEDDIMKEFECIERSLQSVNNAKQVKSENNALKTFDCQEVDLQSFNKPSSWCSYIIEGIHKNENCVKEKLQPVDVWTKWFEFPDCLNIDVSHCRDFLNTTLLKDIQDRNKKISESLEDYKKIKDSFDTTQMYHTKFALKYMNWAYILCFEDNCYFNFESLKNNVHCIGGKNGYGKTSFLETICIALFGEGFPSRCNKQCSSSIICQKTPNNSRAFTSIVFDVDQNCYRLLRTFEKVSTDKNKLQAKDIILEIWNHEKEKFEEFNSGKKASQEWMNMNVGNIESFLTSCMISQCSEEDFFSKKIIDQKQYLDQQLQLNSSTSFLTFLKTVYLAYTDISKRVKDVIEVKYNSDAFDSNDNKIDQLKNELLENKENENTLIFEKSSLDQKLNQSKMDDSDFNLGIDHFKEKIKENSKQLESLKKEMLFFKCFDEENQFDKTMNNVKYLIEYLGREKNCLFSSDRNDNFIAELTHLNSLNFQEKVEKIKEIQSEIQKIEIEINTLILTKPKSHSSRNELEKTSFALQNEYNSCQIGLNNMEEECKEYNSLKTIENTTKEELSILEIKKNGISSLVEDFEREKNNAQIELNKVIFQKPTELPLFTEEQYIAWKNERYQLENSFGNFDNVSHALELLISKEPQCPKMQISEVERNFHRFENWWSKFVSYIKNSNVFKDLVQSFSHYHRLAIASQEMYINEYEKQVKIIQEYHTHMKTTNANLEHDLQDIEKNKNIILERFSKDKSDIQHFSKLLQDLYESNTFPSNNQNQSFYDEKYGNFTIKYEKYKELKNKVKFLALPQYQNEESYDCLSQIEKLKDLNEKIKDQTQLVSTCEYHDFNPNCEACKTHPWKIKKEKIMSNINVLKSEKSNLYKKLSEFNIEINDENNENDELEKKKNDLITQKEYEEMKLYIKETRKELKALEENMKEEKRWIEEKSNLKGIIEKLQENIYQNETLLKSFEKDTQEKRDFFVQKEKEISQTSSLLDEWYNDMKPLIIESKKNIQYDNIHKDWEKNKNETKHKFDLWYQILNAEDDQLKSKQRRDNFNHWSNLCQELKGNIDNLQSIIISHQEMVKEWYGKCEIKKNDLTLVSQKLEHMEKVKNDIHYIRQHLTILENNRHNIEKDLKWYVDLENKQNEANLCKSFMNIICLENYVLLLENVMCLEKDALENSQKVERLESLYPIWIEKKDIEKQQQELYVNIHIKQRDLKECQEKVITIAKEKANFNKIVDLYNFLSNTHYTLGMIINEFAKFKDWVLEKKIIPIILEHLNYLLLLMCRNHRPISLDCVFVQNDIDKKEKKEKKENIYNSHSFNKSFYWILRDGLLSPPFEKASGFQKCVINLAMRIVLGRLGVTGMKNTQLFIDEGFTSCDGENLDNIPIVLQEMLTLYDSIIIVSHLDELKTCIPSCIQIERNSLNNLSNIRYGNLHSLFHFEKKIDRPKSKK